MSIESKAAREFFAAQIKDLNSATRAVIRASARQFKQEIVRQVKANFRRGSNSNGSFFKAFKIYDLDADASRGPASYVRAGVPFMNVFEEGAVITIKKAQFLIVLLPQGEKLGFRRISKGNPWRKVWAQFGNRFVLKILPNNKMLYSYENAGKLTPVYLFTKSVKLKKRLNFFEPAEIIAKQIPDEIAKLWVMI